MLWLELLLQTFVKPWSWCFYLLKGKLENNTDNWWMVYFCDWNKKKVNLGSCSSACLWVLLGAWLFGILCSIFGWFWSVLWAHFLVVYYSLFRFYSLVLNDCELKLIYFLSLSGIGFLHKHCCYVCCHWLCGSHFLCYII